MRQDRLLRLVAQSPRVAPRARGRPPGAAIGRAGRELVVVRGRRRDVRPRRRLMAAPGIRAPADPRGRDRRRIDREGQPRGAARDRRRDRPRRRRVRARRPARRRPTATVTLMSAPSRPIRSWLMDMDGVLVHEDAARSPARPSSSPRCASARLPFLAADQQLDLHAGATSRRGCGRAVSTCPRSAIWTSALGDRALPRDAAARRHRLRRSARPGSRPRSTRSATSSPTTNPDYVVLGETRTYNFERITQAIRLIVAGARFIATNPDPTGPRRAARCRRPARWRR